MEEVTKPGPRAGSGCCEDGEGEICCGSGCPCGDRQSADAVRTEYVKVGQHNFDGVTGEKAIWVALDYNVRGNDRGWSCQPRVVISNPDLGDPGEVDARVGDPHPESGCCEDGEGEICCGWGCPCRVANVAGAIRTDYVKVGEHNFDNLTGEKAIWVALNYAVRANDRGWACDPRVVISDPDLGDPGDV